jgi:hypothetical protein
MDFSKVWRKDFLGILEKLYENNDLKDYRDVRDTIGVWEVETYVNYDNFVVEGSEDLSVDDIQDPDILGSMSDEDKDERLPEEDFFMSGDMFTSRGMNNYLNIIIHLN